MESRMSLGIAAAMVLVLVHHGAMAKLVQKYTSPLEWPKYNDPDVGTSEKEDWSAHTVEIKPANGSKKHTLHCFALDLGEEGKLKGRGTGCLNIQYATQTRFAEAKIIDNDQKFEVMLEERRIFEEKRINAPIRQPTGAIPAPVEESGTQKAAREAKEAEERKKYWTTTTPSIPLFRHFGQIAPQRLTHPDLVDYYRWLKMELEEKKEENGKITAMAVDESYNPLTLNVFTPHPEDKEKHNAHLSDKGHYPVLVFIHGGSLNSGSPALFDTEGIISQICARHGIVVVMLQYRLGALGFHRNNLGLRDQLTGLKWSKKHIHYFGGDPDRITLAGQSAGAASVTVLALEIMHRPEFLKKHGRLFHKLVLMSSSDLVRNARQVKDIRADLTNHEHGIKGDLTKATAKEILLAEQEAGITNWDFQILSQSNSPDGWFTQMPHTLFAKQLPEYHNMPILVWGMRDEWASMDLKVRDKVLAQLKAKLPVSTVTYTKSYGFVPFCNFMQPYLARYNCQYSRNLQKRLTGEWEVAGAEVAPQQNLAPPEIEDTVSVENISHTIEEEDGRTFLRKEGDANRTEAFVPWQWYDEAWKKYGADLKADIDKHKKALTILAERAGQFHDYYIPVQILTDWYFLLPGLQDAMEFAQLNKVYLAKVVHEANFPERLMPFDTLVAHELDLRFLFMSLRFWRLHRDLGLLHSDPRHLTFGEKIRDFFGNFVIHGGTNDTIFTAPRLTHQIWPHRAAAAAGATAAQGNVVQPPPDPKEVSFNLPYVELSHEGAKIMSGGYMSDARANFWQRLFIKYKEPHKESSSNFSAECVKDVEKLVSQYSKAKIKRDIGHQLAGNAIAIIWKFVRRLAGVGIP